MGQLLAPVLVGAFAMGLASFDRIGLQIVGQPAEVAIADERIFGQVTEFRVVGEFAI